MKILITGGSGFIGEALCKVLVSRNNVVTVLTRNISRTTRMLTSDIQIIDDLDAMTAAPDAIINLAGEGLGNHRWNAHWKQVFRDSRIGTTARLVDWIAKQNSRPRVLISGSAVGYYGARQDSLLDETSEPGHEYQSKLCLDWENEALRAESLDMRVCLLRTGIVLDDPARGGALKAMLPPFRFGLGSWLGHGQQWMSWIHMQDLIELILHLLQHDTLSGPFNATAPQPVTNKTFSQTLGKVLNRPVLYGLPAPVVRLMIGEMSDLLLTGQRVLPVNARESGFEFRYNELGPALQAALGRD